MTPEPTLTLTASDPAAPEGVRSYAIRRHKLGETSEKVARLLDLARAMERWRDDAEHEAEIAAREALRPPRESVPWERPSLTPDAKSKRAQAVAEKSDPPADDRSQGVF